MGYLTRYTLGFLDLPEIKEEVTGELNGETVTILVTKSFDTKEIMKKIIDELSGSPFGESCKWYDHEEDMKKISRMFPSVTFDLYGEGEESGDIWHKYFKNGKMQECPARIVFDEYDERKLK